MAGPKLIAWGHQQYHGVPPSGTMAVILNSPHHHAALQGLPDAHKELQARLDALGCDGGGLQLNIVQLRGAR